MFQVQTLKEYNGDKAKLGSAERFLSGLISVPFYETRINGMLLKVEFSEAMERLKPGVDALLKATSGRLTVPIICKNILGFN